MGEWSLWPHLRVLDTAIRSHLLGETGTDILVISMPPRHGKSQLVSRYLPAHYLWLRPTQHVILASYAFDFAANWGRLSRNAFISACNLSQTMTVSSERNAGHEWQTTRGGGMKTCGVMGDLTGRPANLLIADDLIKNSEQAASETYREKTWEWWRSTAYPRLEPGGKAIVIGTRWHRDDYQSRILKGDAPVTHINLPALAEEDDILGRAPGEPLWPWRFTLDDLQKRRRVIGEYWWLAEYQGRPTQHDRAEWPDSYFEDTIWTDRLPASFEFATIAIDPARGTTTKGSYVPDVFVGWSGGKFWVWADVSRRPVEQAAESAVYKAKCFPTDLVYVEGNGVQHLVADVVRQVAAREGLPHLLVQAVDSFGNKLDRIRRLGPRLAQGQIRFLDCPGCHTLVEQLKDFPIGDYFDGPDALEMAIRSVNQVACVRAENEQFDDGGVLTF